MTSFLCGATASAQRDSFEGPPINYMTAATNDPVSKLAAKVETGEVCLSYDRQHGYLKSVLEALDVPISSQTLVFSKTSLQLRRISPHRPRALYFNDDVYVGWCQRGDVIEFAATDAKQGAMFYTLSQSEDAAPKFVRDRGQCLTCHASSRTQNVPGYLVRSVFADSGGQPILGSGTYNTDQTSPFEERWGGWYVTGTHGEMRHMGNITYEEDDTDGDREAGANRESLEGIVSTTPYLSPHSDLVALMVLEHQTQMHNAIAAANYETREAIHQSYQMNEFLERAPDYLSESAQRRIASSADRVVNHLLMCDEFALTSPVQGTSGFAEEFAARGIRDAKGRSLRDLDLNTRLFRYPCSYLIYSDAFDGLPEQVRSKIIDRLTAILENKVDDPEFAHLTPTMRSEILAILRQTKPEFADKKETSSL
ncbi:hypothetical protein GCM10023156_41320 [Novipirellula rosea]|uniref:Cytochrome c domain-containing protein n=2 Tax=Novipirellula rosea TaxID=1031540 RepID=A0ABP8N2Z3_9BACT